MTAKLGDYAELNYWPDRFYRWARQAALALIVVFVFGIANRAESSSIRIKFPESTQPSLSFSSVSVEDFPAPEIPLAIDALPQMLSGPNSARWRKGIGIDLGRDQFRVFGNISFVRRADYWDWLKFKSIWRDNQIIHECAGMKNRIITTIIDYFSLNNDGVSNFKIDGMNIRHPQVRTFSFGYQCLRGRPEAGGVEKQKASKDSQQPSWHNKPPVFRRLAALLVGLGNGYWVAIRGWSNFDNERRVRGAAQICCGYAIALGGIGIWCLTLFRSTWHWWL